MSSFTDISPDPHAVSVRTATAATATNRFGFVELADDTLGRKAVDELAGQDWNGRSLTVNEARPQEGRSPGGLPGGPRRGPYGIARGGGHRH